MPYLQTATTAAAVQDAPKVVQAVARVEVARTGAGVAGEDDVKSFVQKAVAGKVGDEALAGAITEAAMGEAIGRAPPRHAWRGHADGCSSPGTRQ